VKNGHILENKKLSIDYFQEKNWNAR